MNFKYWLLILNENVEQNWDLWCDNLEKYAQNNPSEKRILNALKDVLDSVYGNLDLKLLIGSTHARASGRSKANAIINVLKEKNVENYNWFAFSMGFIVSYNGNFHDEDLRAAIDETKRRISSGELPKSEIGAKGWLVIGSESKSYVDAAIERSQEISKREQERLKKSGQTLSEDSRLIQTVAKEGDYTLYRCPKLSFYKEDEKEKEKLIGERHMILCKYGKGGNFCTADPTGTYHRNYAKNDIYIFHVKDKVKYQFVSCDDALNHQFHDVRNLPPKEVLGDEYDFLMIHAAPIGCYKLPVVDTHRYEDLIEKIKSGNFNRITLSTIEKSLMRAAEEKSIDNIELFLNAAVKIWHENTANSRIRLSSIIEEIIENNEESFVQKVIKKILDIIYKGSFEVHMLDSDTWFNIAKAANLENLDTIYSKSPSKISRVLSPQELMKIIEKFDYSFDIIKILAKAGSEIGLPSEHLVKVLLLSKDKQKTINAFRASGVLENIGDSVIADLLMCRVPTPTKTSFLWNRTPPDESKPVKVPYTSGKEMASMLGSEIVSKLTLKHGMLDSKMEPEQSGKVITWHGIDLTAEQIKGFLEGIAAKHENMDGDDVYNLIRKYKQLNIHKAEEKITKILGKRKVALLSKNHRSSLRVNY